ncbi:hypothetical protein AU210_000065 [Fusarium oxysporum f. sp. radicis-cucumerinum]|uniref:Uncharacterized protein n=1 Tax=Fusarium oxysporum f. sp. radicis-cucumerinum TaxID=327505 RepID=A0A2H3HWK8_FUSOX|nr:hypothetical protein AU210_000065 [Fusarium oxysporum f. sp. radicis-cucumerinum]
MSVLGSQSGLSEQTLSDADDSNVPIQLLTETIDRRKAQNRIAQRKHSQSPPIFPSQPYSIALIRPCSCQSTFWNAQEHSSLSEVSPPLGYITTLLPAAAISPLQIRNLTGDTLAQDSSVNRGFTYTSARRGIEPPTPSLLMTPTTEINEILAVPDVSRRSSSHPMSDAAELDDPATPPCSWNMERKIAYIVECAKTLGFRDFDSVVTTYYTRSFEVMSRAHDMQRVSRIRGLGSVLRTIDASAEAWPHHESQIYQAEIFKAAEHLYRAEFQRAIDSGTLMVLEERQRLKEDEMNRPAVKLTSHKSELLSQLPNLWTFLLELSECNPPTSFNALLHYYLSYQKDVAADQRI